MSDKEADGALDVGQQESMLGKDGSDHDFFRARFDALTAEESRLLRKNIELGTTKSDAPRRKVIMATLEEIQAECCLLQNYLQRGAAASTACR
jgi:hypothetical protein